MVNLCIRIMPKKVLKYKNNYLKQNLIFIINYLLQMKKKRCRIIVCHFYFENLISNFESTGLRAR